MLYVNMYCPTYLMVHGAKSTRPRMLVSMDSCRIVTAAWHIQSMAMEKNGISRLDRIVSSRSSRSSRSVSIIENQSPYGRSIIIPYLVSMPNPSEQIQTINARLRCLITRSTQQERKSRLLEDPNLLSIVPMCYHFQEIMQP